MATLKWGTSDCSGGGDASVLDGKPQEVIVLSKKNPAERIRVLKLPEIFTGMTPPIELPRSTELKAIRRIFCTRELLDAIGLVLGAKRLPYSPNVHDEDRFEELDDDEEQDAGEGHHKKSGRKQSASVSGKKQSSASSSAGASGSAGRSAASGGGGKKPPGGGRRFLGPYAPSKTRKRKRGRKNKRGRKAKKQKMAQSAAETNTSGAESEVDLSGTTSPTPSLRPSPAVSPTHSRKSSESSVISTGTGPTFPPQNKKRSKARRNRKVPAKTECETGCECWEGGKEATVQNFPDSCTGVQQRHRIIVHQHQCHNSVFNKLQAMTNSIQELREDMDNQRHKVSEVLQFVKTLAAERKFDEQRQKDMSALGLKFSTMTQLQEALDENEDVLARTLAYCNQDDDNEGANFFKNYLNSIMDISLLFRLFPAEENSSGGTHSFIFAQEYFRLPSKFQDMLFHYCNKKWPHYWRLSRCQKRLTSLLEYYRKTRSIQMRNLLLARTRNPACHPLFFAIYWDWFKKSKVFTRPAPLWGINNDSDRDEYLQRFQEDWDFVVVQKHLDDWDSEVPEPRPNRETEQQSKALRSQLAPRAEMEPYWEYTD